VAAVVLQNELNKQLFTCGCAGLGAVRISSVYFQLNVLQSNQIWLLFLTFLL